MAFRNPIRHTILFLAFGLLLAAPALARTPDKLTATATEDAPLRPFTIAGEIVDEHANPAPRVTVTILAHGGRAVTDDLGRYIIDTRIPLDADSIAIVASLPDEHTGQRITTHTASIEHDDPFLDAGTLTMRSDECEPSWAEDVFCWVGPSGRVRAAIAWDDGTGEALYIAGFFTMADCSVVNRIAKWDGTEWSALADGMNNEVRALTIFDDGFGSGPALYAGGLFTTAGGVEVNHIARWDGTQWSAVGGGVNDHVFALTVFDDGTGEALYVAGNFTTSRSIEANGIARWDGTQWSALGSGVSSSIFALTVFDDESGGGPALYAGGSFTQAGGSSANRIARWDGTQWSALGNGVNGAISGLAVFDDGMGPALYAGGLFTQADGNPSNSIARWDGSSWAALGSGVSGGPVSTLAVFDDGSGNGAALYAGGTFTTAGGVPTNRIAKWDGTQWSAVGSPSVETLSVSDPRVHAFAVFDDGSGGGSALYAGGDFRFGGDVQANHIAKWNGTDWSSLKTTGSQGVIGLAITALNVFDDGTGPALYAGGIFNAVGNVQANNIARWDGTKWSALGSPESQGVYGTATTRVLALTVFDDGTGDALYVGGSFNAAGGVPASRIAKWDGTQWSALGSPENQGVNSWVWDFAVFDDGTGPALYVGGDFRFAGDILSGGIEVNRIARWDGSNWSALSGPSGTGMGSGSGITVHALQVFDDGSGGGPDLYAAGLFVTAGGVQANNIARWDGTEWSALGSPGSVGFVGNNPRVLALTVFDDGTGEKLYAGGDFTIAGGVSANHIARWDGSSWSSLGPPENQGVSNRIWTLTALDDGTGSGPALFAGGAFIFAGGIEVNRIAKWNGTEWSALGPPGQPGVDWTRFCLTDRGV